MARQKKIICLFLAALWTVAVFGLSVNPVLSTTLQSSNYRVIDYNLGYGGGYSTSTAYAVQSNIELVVDAQKVAPANPPGGDGTITAPPPPPPPPPDTTPPIISSVQATNITTTGTNIVWSTNEAADSFVEYGATTAYGTSVSSSTLVTSHNLSLGGLTPATPYHFRVKSKDASSNQAVSVDYTFMTASLVDTAAPAISNIKVADITGASASILWDTDEVSTSQVKYGPTSAYGAVKTDSSLAVSHKVDLTGLVPDALYHFQVISADAKNNIATSGDQTFRTLDTIAPVISNIQVINILSRTANVTWVTNEATASQVFYRRQGESAYGSVSDSNLSVSHSMSLSGLVPNVAYEFYIVAKDSALNTATSALGSFKTLTDSIPPANIKNFTATPDDGLIVLTWQNPIDIDFFAFLS